MDGKTVRKPGKGPGRDWPFNDLMLRFIFCKPGINMQGVVLITGASRGIGAACATLAAQQGWDVAVNYARDEAAAHKVVAQVQALGRRAVAIQGDVGAEADILRLFDTVDDQLGRLSGLINNAGIVATGMRMEGYTWDRMERIMRINVLGTLACCREAVKRMSRQHGGTGGSIVNLSSAAARLGGANDYVDYAASKGAIDTLTLGLSKELAPDGIRVNAIRPGLIDTEIHASGGKPNRAFELSHLVPLQRPGTAEEVAQAAVWLLGEASSYCTGSIIDVAGGR
jgi:NAD(P)-dependent dehydrogenase (short-subunit alcohol dehydrogenase family)